MAFAIQVVKLKNYLKEQKHEYNIADQIQRSGTAIGANHREAMMNSYDANREIIAHVFDMEKLYYVDGNFVDAVAGLKQVLEIGYPREDVSSAIDALRDICKTRSAESMYVGIIRKCGY